MPPRWADGIAAMFAFGSTDIPILDDWRLRECEFGAPSGSPGAAAAP
jgi:hypothetical protein